MKNGLYPTLLATLLGIACIDAQNVGINKDNPQYTLDVKGTMRIGDTSGAENNPIPLGWNSQTQQVTKLLNDTKKPFYKVTYRIKINEFNEDWIHKLDLGIDASKYSAFLKESILVIDDEKLGREADPALIKMVSEVRGEKTQIEVTDGRIYRENTLSAIAGPESGDFNDMTRLAYVFPNIDVFEENNKILLSADYAGTSPVGNRDKFVWYITLLIVDKQWVKLGGTTTLSEPQNNPS